jgi:hypothetical protein
VFTTGAVSETRLVVTTGGLGFHFESVIFSQLNANALTLLYASIWLRDSPICGRPLDGSTL